MSEDQGDTHSCSPLPIVSCPETSSGYGKDEPGQNKKEIQQAGNLAELMLEEQMQLCRTPISEDAEAGSCLHLEGDITLLDPEEEVLNGMNDFETGLQHSKDHAQRDTNIGVNFCDLPAEVVHHIWSYFTLAELCRYISPVCHWWRDLALDPIHWQTLTLGHLSSESLCKCLQRATLLKNLNISGHKELSFRELTALTTNCPQLQNLELGFCEINERELRIITDNSKNLEHINLEGCRLINDACMKPLGQMTKLRSVNLSHCTFVTTQGIEVLVEGLPWLEKLNIDGIADIRDSAVLTLVLHHGDHLVSLEIDGAEMTDAAVQAIAKCSGLTTLTVSFAELMTDVALSFLRELRSLQTLGMKKGADFSNRSLSELFTVSTFTSLTHLDLSECPQLLDSGVCSLVKCCGKSLERLHLRWCWNVTDDGLSAIVDGCPKMKVLDLLGLDRIRGHCIEHIPGKMPKLCLLDLQQCNKFLDELVANVVQALPNLIVYNYYGERFQLTSDGVIAI